MSLIKEALESIKNEPQDWIVDPTDTLPDSMGPFQIINEKRKLAIWMANSYYGTGVCRIRGPLFLEYAGVNVWSRAGSVEGGVTMISTLFGPFIPWRRKLYKFGLSVLAKQGMKVIGAR